jgi:hypothetical protein
MVTSHREVILISFFKDTRRAGIGKKYYRWEFKENGRYL